MGFVVQMMFNSIDTTQIIEAARGQFRYMVVESYDRVDSDLQVFYNRRGLDVLP